MILNTLKIMGLGMLSIFIVMGLMYAAVKILNKVTRKTKREDESACFTRFFYFCENQF